MYIVRGASMTPEIPLGAVVVIHRVAPDGNRPGDVITFRSASFLSRGLGFFLDLVAIGVVVIGQLFGFVGLAAWSAGAQAVLSYVDLRNLRRVFLPGQACYRRRPHPASHQ